MRLASAITTFAATATECVIRGSIRWASALPPAWSRLVANSPSAHDSNGPECTGRYLAPTQSSRCVAAFSAAALRTSGSVAPFERRRLSRPCFHHFLVVHPNQLHRLKGGVSRQSRKFRFLQITRSHGSGSLACHSHGQPAFCIAPTRQGSLRRTNLARP